MISDRETVFIIYQDRAKEYRVRLKGGNGEIMLTSEGYSRLSDAKRAITKMRVGIMLAQIVIETPKGKKK